MLSSHGSLATRGEDWASQGQPKGKAEIPVALSMIGLLLLSHFSRVRLRATP